MRSFSKKLASVLAVAAMVVTMFPASKALAADDFTLNRTTATLYVNKGDNDHGVVGGGLYGNVQEYDFNLKNKPANWKDGYSYKWTSSNEKVAKVAAGGITTAVGVGTATISCTITDKATGKTATLKATVTVKANAKNVIISNAVTYDGTSVEVGDVVDLNRTMFDATGNKTSARGKFVTDYTKWVAELVESDEADSKVLASSEVKDQLKGVEINQNNGQYTFTEDAEAGSYKLYCYTYQSTKYSQPTATSEAVIVTLENNTTFEVQQKTLNKFTMNFGAPVKSLTTADVEVIRLFEAGSAVYEYPQGVKSVKLADDSLSATVEMFSNFQNNINYVVKVTGFDDYTMTASAGVPVSMTISADENTISPFVTAGKEAQLYYKLYDANNVDVTTGTETVLFNTESYSTDGSYYVAGNKICFFKSGLTATVVAEYQSGRIENGVLVGNVPAKMEFHSVDAAPVVLKGVVDATVTSFGNDKTLTVPMGDTAKLMVKVARSQGDPVEVNSNGQEIPGLGRITFEETTPDVLAINKDNMNLILFKQGIANIIVNLVTKDSNGIDVSTPVGVVNINVAAPRALTTVTVDQPLTTVGTATNYATEFVKVTAKDQYGKDITVTNVKFDGVNEAAKKVVTGVTYNYSDNKIRLDGSVLVGALDGNANAIQLTYKATVEGLNGSKEVSFSVLVKKPGVSEANYINIETVGFGDVARTVDSKNAKTATFTVFLMNNGIKVDTQEIAPYPNNWNETAEAGKYYVKVTRDGQEITNKVVVTGGAVIINFSHTEGVDNGAVTGSAVKYDFGAGNYIVTLYKCIMSGENKVPVQQQSAAGVATCNTGSYSAAVKVADSVATVGQASIRACFEVKDTKGNNAENKPYYVDYDATSTDYVFVKSITFYDEVATGEYAAYTVNVGTSLKKKSN